MLSGGSHIMCVENQSSTLVSSAKLGDALDGKAIIASKISNVRLWSGETTIADTIEAQTDTSVNTLHYLCQTLVKRVFKNKGDPFARLLAMSETQHATTPEHQPYVDVRSARRQRKSSKPLRTPSCPEPSHPKQEKSILVTMTLCKNVACKAVLPLDAQFCHRCSCCICKRFDDNKDPSLWMGCGENSNVGCGLSCHIECALKEGKAGVVELPEGQIQFDGSYCCPSCGKVSSLISFWKKQLLVAKEARRVDIFCYRLFLSFRLLKGTKAYKYVHSCIDEAVKRLEKELGSLTEGIENFKRGIVNRLSSNATLQELISLALEKADAVQVLASCSEPKASEVVQSEAKCSTNVVPICANKMEKQVAIVRNVDLNQYPENDELDIDEPPYKISRACNPESQMVSFHARGSQSPMVLDEKKECMEVIDEYGSQMCASGVLQVHDSKLETVRKTHAGMTNEIAIRDEERAVSHLRIFHHGLQVDHVQFEFSVRVIRWLECKGHLTTYFRMKFLTWYSTRASENDRRIVGVYIESLQDDPASLAAQLRDTFEDIVSSKRQGITFDSHGNDSYW